MSPGRKNIMLGTAGHVDHGKTALVKLLTGCETDTLAEEKARGLTIDLGFAPCRLANDHIVGIVDVPGHVDFIRNMAAGAHGIDVALLVVAADDGLMPQTHEHLQILTWMGLRHGLVALTKIDLVDAARRQHVANELRRLLAGTFLEHAPICPLSNITGEGFEAFFDALNRVADACEERANSGLFRMWVEDVFTIRGAGTVITGIPTTGTIRPGETLSLLPPGSAARVRRMQVYGADATEGRAGECVALNLPDIDHQAARRGMVLCETDALPPTAMAEAELTALPTLTDPIPDYQEVHLHIGTAAVLAHVALLESDALPPGQKQMAQLRLADTLPLVPGERFVIRANRPLPGQSGLTTIGGGRILGTSNVRLRRKRQWTLAALAVRAAAIDDPVRWLECVVREAAQPLSLADLRRQCCLREQEISALADRLVRDGLLQLTGSRAWVHASLVRQSATKLLGALEGFHASHPDRTGFARDELLSATRDHPEVFDLAVKSLIASGQAEAAGTVLARAGSSARLSEPDQRLCDQLLEKFRVAGWASPTFPELAASFREPEGRIAKMVRQLQERGLLVRLDERVSMHRDAIENAKQVALRLWARAPSFSTMAFRDALAVSRKYAVPLLDYLDQHRFTVRCGHDRTPGVEARKLLSSHEH